MWRAETAQTKILPLGVNQPCISVDDIGHLTSCKSICNKLLYCSWGGKSIACIDVPHVVSSGTLEPFVHGIVESMISLTEDQCTGSELSYEL